LSKEDTPKAITQLRYISV